MTADEISATVSKWRNGDLPDLSEKIRHGEMLLSIPVDDDPSPSDMNGNRRSSRFQAMLAGCGEKMGFRIWIPVHDRTAVKKHWTPIRATALIDQLPLTLSYSADVLKIIERIDVLWLKGHAIIRAFEVEDTTSIYSGILRMADLHAMVPNMDVEMHIVAPDDRRDKVIDELKRPAFNLSERKPLLRLCSYLSYESVQEICDLPHLEDTRDSLLEKYVERVDESDADTD
jgi:hypothetical protein